MSKVGAIALLLVAAACGDNLSSRNPSTGDADAAAGTPDARAPDAGPPDGAAEPSLVVFDNADGTFVWTPFWQYADPCCSDSGVGAYLDLRLPPTSQTGEGDSLSAIRFFKEYPYPLTNWGGFLFQSWYDPDSPTEGAMFAAAEDVLLEADWEITVVPPLPKSPGDTVGPDDRWVSGELRDAEWYPFGGVQTVHVQDPGSQTAASEVFFSAGLIGVKFTVEDGTHYGFVELAWDPQDRFMDALHIPVRWGYNPVPDERLVIPP